jgi:hypothetical protein
MNLAIRPLTNLHGVIAGTTFFVITSSTASEVACAASRSNLAGFGPSK